MALKRSRGVRIPNFSNTNRIRISSFEYRIEYRIIKGRSFFHKFTFISPYIDVETNALLQQNVRLQEKINICKTVTDRLLRLDFQIANVLYTKYQHLQSTYCYSRPLRLAFEITNVLHTKFRSLIQVATNIKGCHAERRAVPCGQEAGAPF